MYSLEFTISLRPETFEETKSNHQADHAHPHRNSFRPVQIVVFFIMDPNQGPSHPL